MDSPVIQMVLRSDWMGQGIVYLLLSLSVISWAIIISRMTHLGTLARLNRQFQKFYAGIGGLTDMEKAEKRFERAPMALLGKAGVTEYRRILEDARAHPNVKDWSFFFENQFSMASERLETTFVAAASGLSRGAFVLAILSSVAPFFGLFGTVWGIMNSFYEIGNQGSASLPVVAPGIAAALITTIVGLAVAIPAVIFYNVIVHKTQRMEDDMDEFKELLFSRLKREILSLLYGARPEKKAPAQE